MIEILTENTTLKWFSWQMFEVPRDILRAWRNFLIFGLEFFSIPLLIKTFLSPWRTYKCSYPKGLDIWVYIEVFVSNLIFRVLGAVFRTVLIFIGIIFEILIILAGFFIFFGWLILPFLLLFGLYHGFRLLFF